MSAIRFVVESLYVLAALQRDLVMHSVRVWMHIDRLCIGS